VHPAEPVTPSTKLCGVVRRVPTSLRTRRAPSTTMPDQLRICCRNAAQCRTVASDRPALCMFIALRRAVGTELLLSAPTALTGTDSRADAAVLLDSGIGRLKLPDWT
jgi:hypothetical protein